MVEPQDDLKTKKENFWNNMNKKGKQDAQIQQLIDKILEEHMKETQKSLFTPEPDSHRFTDEYTQVLMDQIEDVLTDFDLPSSDRNLKVESAIDRLNKYLYLKIQKKALSTIEFPAYDFYRFIQALKGLIEETELIVEEDGIKINGMDPSRVCLFVINITNDSFYPLRTGKLGINLNDLEKLVKCKSTDKSTLHLTISTDKAYLTLTSEKYNSIIDRILEGLDINIEEIPLDNLKTIDYPIRFALTREQFEHTLSNTGIYSEVLHITGSPKRIEFSEAGEIGDETITWERKVLPYIDADFGILHKLIKELKGDLGEIASDSKTTDPRSLKIKKLEARIEQEKSIAVYSHTFLRAVGKIAPLLEKNDPVHFSLRTDHPFKVETNFSPLGTTQFCFFLGPRVQEAEFDEIKDEINEF
ncbi:MAG: hypothetical protein R6U96_09340 [Promethearchaeia archaeon]